MPDVGAEIELTAMLFTQKNHIARFSFLMIVAALLLPLLAIGGPPGRSGTDTTPPAVPTKLRSTGQTTTTISLAWRASSDNKGGSGIAGYDVARNGTLVGGTTLTSYTDAGLTPATSYQYAVRARDKAGNPSAWSSAITASTLAQTTCSALPSVPTGLSSPSKTSTSISLAWNASAPQPNCTVTYNVFTDGSQTAGSIGGTTYTVTGLGPSATHSFTVSATNQFGSSAQTPPITVTTDPGAPPGVFPLRVFAPYVDMLLWPTPSLPDFATQTGNKFYTAAFIVAGSGCQASWGGSYTMSQAFLTSQIASLRSMGGDVIVSFGGAVGTELAGACATAQNLQAQYQSVIDTYNLTRIDFDIEGSILSDSASVNRRNQAIAGLQSAAGAAGKQLFVQYTLPVMPTGLTTAGINLLKNAVSNGVNVGAVNIMTMDYGSSANPNTMVQNAIDAMNATFAQLQGIFGLIRTDSQIRLMEGVTPMIGLNDVSPEVFTLSDASLLLSAAQQNNIGLLAMWSMSRDQQCAGSPKLSSTCSGVTQSPYAFTNIFKVFTGN